MTLWTHFWGVTWFLLVLSDFQSFCHYLHYIHIELTEEVIVVTSAPQTGCKQVNDRLKGSYCDFQHVVRMSHVKHKNTEWFSKQLKKKKAPCIHGLIQNWHAASNDKGFTNKIMTVQIYKMCCLLTFNSHHANIHRSLVNNIRVNDALMIFRV